MQIYSKKKSNNKLAVDILKNPSDFGYQCRIGNDRAISNSRPSVMEIFTTILVVDLCLHSLSEENVSQLVNHINSWHKNGFFSFFADENLLPPDADVTSMGLSILLERKKINLTLAMQRVDSILENVSHDGIIQVYFDRMRPRIDPIVCINSLYLITFVGKHNSPSAIATREYIYDLLINKTYKNQYVYYITEETFLYFLTRLIVKFPLEHEKFFTPLSNDLCSKIGRSTYPLDVAMRVIMCALLKVNNLIDLQILNSLQNPDGSWPADALFKYGRSEEYFGCKELTTAFSLKALECHSTMFKDKKLTVTPITPQAANNGEYKI